MTEILCYGDSYLKEFEAVVTGSALNGVVLNQTAFYPGGGGQPSDIGLLSGKEGDYKVTKIVKHEGVIVHVIEGDIPEIGDAVKGVIDWTRRYQLMRTHTALHILCGVVWREFGAKVTGGNMQPGSARMDFELDSMSSDFAEQVENLINTEVKASRSIVVENFSREEAFKIPDLIRTKINLLPPAIKEIRTVNIEGLDLQADGGTHVSNTCEVGNIRVTGHESKGRINKRLRIEIDL